MKAAGTGPYSLNDARGAWQSRCRDLDGSLQRERFDDLLKAEAHCLLLEDSPLRKLLLALVIPELGIES